NCNCGHNSHYKGNNNSPKPKANVSGNGDQTSRLKWDCPVFGHHVPLSRQTSNGTLFIPFLEDCPVLFPIVDAYSQQSKWSCYFEPFKIFRWTQLLDIPHFNLFTISLIPFELPKIVKFDKFFRKYENNLTILLNSPIFENNIYIVVVEFKVKTIKAQRNYKESSTLHRGISRYCTQIILFELISLSNVPFFTVDNFLLYTTLFRCNKIIEKFFLVNVIVHSIFVTIDVQLFKTMYEFRTTMNYITRSIELILKNTNYMTMKIKEHCMGKQLKYLSKLKKNTLVRPQEIQLKTFMIELSYPKARKKILSTYLKIYKNYEFIHKKIKINLSVNAPNRFMFDNTV
ncbi:hypothetical protein AGLY_010620, partial [Aphis glycines]